jgi:CHAT domain-containing protein/tetratricopeptide (TPR) repeat protein
MTMSIYRAAKPTERATRRIGCIPLRILLLMPQLCSAAAPSTTSTPPVSTPTSCSRAFETAAPYLRQRFETHGTDTASRIIALAPGREWLIEVREQGNDVTVQVADAAGRLLAQADHPERRTGTRRLILSSGVSQPLTLRITGKEHEAVSGAAELSVFDLAPLKNASTCVQALTWLAAADADYAVGQQISRGQVSGAAGNAHDAYQRAAQGYLAAEMLLDDPADTELRGEAALALAGVHYFDLQDWAVSAQWALSAADLFAGRDPYRQARAQAVAAAAWIEMANSDPRLKPLFAKARSKLRALYAIHSRQADWYDAALQINNIAVAYVYEGRYDDCIAAAGKASRLFGELGEAPRQGLAWQNRAVCYWGLGHLTEALGAFNRALKTLGPEPYPQLYTLTLNNTALMNFALGHFDEALRLLDRALALANRRQNRRAEAQSLYGIGVTYYGLGDLDQSREFLERALILRTAAVDGRGRRLTLRSLATVYADLGQYGSAIRFDREALELASTPNSRDLSRIALATHTALDGRADEALAILGEVLAPGAIVDPLVRARARLQRAVIQRARGEYAFALRDLAQAISVLRRLGSQSDGFAADFERAQDFNAMGAAAAAMAAVDSALARSEAIRTQSANPEFRAQLQLPLRAAYDLKFALLWGQFDKASMAGNEPRAARIASIAFRSADGARARSFADIAAQRYTSAVRHDLDAELNNRAELYRKLSGLQFALDSRLDRSGSLDPRAKELKGDFAGLQRQVDTLNAAIAGRVASSPHPLVASGPMLPLPADAAIITYWLGAETAYAWTLTPAGIHWARLADTATITARARAFHDSLSRLSDTPRERRLEDGQALSAEILQPLAPWIAAYKRWFFVTDAALNYVPFAALRIGPDANAPYAVVAHDIAVAPAAWLLLTPRPPNAAPLSTSRMLLVSDPVYDAADPRFAVHEELAHDGSRGRLGQAQQAAQVTEAYPRLAGTAREARAIENVCPATANAAAASPATTSVCPAIEIDALSGFDATRERLLDLDWSRYRYIHIASHGHLDARIPQLSSLILSAYDRQGVKIEAAIRTADLQALNLRADVAVFSACDTALGKDVLNEGMVGIAYATLARGAHAVVSSLWQVPDEIGANLMTELYGHLMRDSMSPVPALSASLRSELKRNPPADPALWAAFQISVSSL